MDDLISRSALIKVMEKKYEVAEKKAFYSVGLSEGFIVTEEIIKEQPTAYDVEAVVKQIEEFYPDAEHYVFSGAITDIIEIVRNGGVK